MEEAAEPCRIEIKWDECPTVIRGELRKAGDAYRRHCKVYCWRFAPKTETSEKARLDCLTASAFYTARVFFKQVKRKIVKEMGMVQNI